MIKEYNLKSKLPHIISVIILVLMAALLISRSQFGLDWSDETYYSAMTYTNLMSGGIFQNMHLLSFWPLILGPLVDLYIIVAGNTSGIILFLRICYILFTLGLSIYLYKTAVKVVTPWVAFIVSAILLIFIPVNIPTLSYNSIVILMTLLSILLINNGITGNKISYFHIILSGFCFGIAVVSYPTILIALLVLPIHLLIKSFHINKLNRKWDFVLVWFLGFLIIPILILANILLNYSGPEIIENISRLFNNTTFINNGLNIKNVLFKYFEPIQAFFPNKLLWFFVVTILAFLNTRFKKERLTFNTKLNNHERLTYVGTIILLIVFVILEFLMFTLVLSQTNMAYAFIPLTLGMPIFYFITNKFSSKYMILYLMGIFLSIAMYLSTNDFNVFLVGLILSTIAVILYIGEYLMKEDFDLKYKIPIYGIIFYFGFVVLFSLSSNRLNTVYRDEPISKLSTSIKAGPGKGLITTKESATKYDKIYKAIKDYVPDRGTVLFTRDLPFGYLCTNASPSFPKLSNIDIGSEYLNKYFSSKYYLLPDCVFQVADGYGYLKDDGSYSNDNNPVVGNLGELLKSSNYETITLDCATIYLKVK